MRQLGDLVGQLLGGCDEQLAKRTRVDEAKLAPLREGNDNVGVAFPWLLRIHPQQLPAHPEMGDEKVRVVQPDQQVLAFAGDTGHLVASRRDTNAFDVRWR